MAKAQLSTNLTNALQFVKRSVYFPYYYSKVRFQYLWSVVNSLRPVDILFRFIILFTALATTQLYWHMMKFFSNNDIPMSVVLTGSMEPGFVRGDAVALYTYEREPELGDIIVWTMTKKPIPIVHRIIEKRIINGSNAYVTKGDANGDCDIQLYDNGLTFIFDKDFLATGDFIIPSLGYVTIFYTESWAFWMFYYYNIIKNGFLGYYEG